jgi:hypothetical protein
MSHVGAQRKEKVSNVVWQPRYLLFAATRRLWKTIKRLSPFGGGGGGSGKRTKLPCCDICNAAHSSSPNTSSPVPHIQIDLTEADMMGAQLSRAAVVNDILGVVASSDIGTVSSVT